MRKLIATIIAAVILLTVNLLAMCGCTQVMVRSWFLEKEYDIDISFEDFKTAAKELDEEKYFVKVDYESAPGDARMTIIQLDNKCLANITKESDPDKAKSRYDWLSSAGGQLMTNEAIVRVSDMVLEGNGQIIKQLLDGVGIKTHDPIVVPAGKKIKHISGLVPFDEAKRFLEAKGYVFYPPYENETVEGTVYVICSPDGTESYTVIAFWMQKTNEEARAATSWLDPGFSSDHSAGLNIYYCNTYAVRCIGDRWMKITEGIEN